MKRFVFLKHTADVKFQAFGKKIEKAFENSAFALKETITKKLKIKDKIKKKFIVEGKDNESLLYGFLEEFLYFMDAENFLFSKIKSLKIEKGKLTAEILGDKASNYKFTNDVKAVTYNQMFVRRTSDGWVCQVVLDV